MQVEEERAAGVADIGDVNATAGQPPDEVGIDGAEENLAALTAFAQAGDSLKQIDDLRAGEIRIEHQAGLLPEGFFVAFGFQPLANRRADAALPDDGVR